MDPKGLLAIAAVGLVAGFVNTLAGGGSFLTLPALILLGLPPSVANGTNRVGVAVQSLGAAAVFRRSGVLQGRLALRLGSAVAVGGALGAQLSLRLDEAALQRVVALALLALIGTIFIDPRRWEGRAPPRLPGGAVAEWAIYLAIGVYGGFLQAGVGLFLTVALCWLSGLDLVRAAALRTLLVLALTAPALAVFLAGARVHWIPAIALSVGSSLGGAVGAWVAWRGGARLLRYALAGAMALSAVQLLREAGS